MVRILTRNKMNQDTDSTKSSIKMMVDQGVKHKTLKLQENNRKNLGDLGYGDDFLDTVPMTWSLEEITDNPGFI